MGYFPCCLMERADPNGLVQNHSIRVTTITLLVVGTLWFRRALTRAGATMRVHVEAIAVPCVY